MHRLFNLTLVALLALALNPLSAEGGSATDAANRIKARLVMIDELKASGAVGEGALGYVIPRAELGPRQSSIVESENADRKTLYQSVAANTGQSAEEVGRQRALQIATRARPGVWLQGPDGEWYQKS
jgi:uncharacterized protein YdbL (DUF1318 family)